MKIIEKFYGKTFKKILQVINPFKKIVIKTECEVHKFNNIHAINLLKKFDYDTEYAFFKKYINELNTGVVWADQDFKSINHFYSPKRKRGLFGHSHSLELTQDYYSKALENWKNGQRKKAMFYLGACVHIIQDLTVCQHVNNRLLDNHRQYENFVKYTYDLVKEYKAIEEPIILNNPKEYIEFNARVTLKIDEKYQKVKDRKLRFYYKTLSSLPLAQTTTAGCFLMFLIDLNCYRT